MAYAILRIEKTKNGSIAGKNSHNMRLRKTHNADPTLKDQNLILIGSGDLRTDINTRFENTNVSARNSTSVICNELVLTASPEFFTSNKKLEDWVNVQMQYLKGEYGDNAINAVLHLDEQTPHIHAFITPIENKNGVYKLNNKGYMKNYKTAQDIYFKYNKPLGLIRGVEKELTNAKYTEVKEFYSDIKNTKSNANLEIENNKPSSKILVKETEMKNKLFSNPVEVARHYTGAETNSAILKAVTPYRTERKALTRRLNGFKSRLKHTEDELTALRGNIDRRVQERVQQELNAAVAKATAEKDLQLQNKNRKIKDFELEIVEYTRQLKEKTTIAQRYESYKIDSDVLNLIRKHKPDEIKNLVHSAIASEDAEYTQKHQKNNNLPQFKPKSLKM
jgi:hypothetical protein